MTDEIHKNDIGTDFIVPITDDGEIVELQAATTTNIIFRKPSGLVMVKNALLYTDGSDGKIFYKTILDDLDEVGDWSIQAHVILPSGDWKSDISVFPVHSNLS